MSDRKKESLSEKTINSTIWAFAEKILGQGASFIVSIFLARLLLPEEYGIIAVASIFISISTVFVDCGLGTSLVQKKKPEKIDYSTAFISSLILSCVMYGILFFLAHPIAIFFGKKYDTDTITILIRLLALKLPMGAFSSVQNAYIQKNFLFQKKFWGSFIGTVLSGVVGVACAYGGMGVYALIVQGFTDGIVDMLLITILTKWLPGFHFSLDSFKKLFGFGSKIFFTTLIDRCYNSLSDFVIGKKYSSADLAMYDKGKQIPNILCSNAESALESALFPAFAQLQDDKEELKKAIQKTIKISAFILFPMLTGLICTARPLIDILMTNKWIGCVPFLVLSSISLMTTSARSPILQAIKAVGRSDLFLKLDIVKKVIGISALLIGMMFGPLWICFAATCSSILGLIVNLIPAKKLFNYGMLEVFVDLIPTSVMTLIMGVITYLLSFFIKQDILLLVLQIPVGMIVYFGLAFVTKNEILFYILDVLKTRLMHLKEGRVK